MADKTNKKESRLFAYWQSELRDYVVKKRTKAGKGQKELGAVSRQTASRIENNNYNPTLRKLLQLLGNIDGDISELFASRIPKSLHGEHQDLHERLQQILETKDQVAIRDITRAIDHAHADFVKK